ncbi:hypothetical protein QC761_401333 [Podospora bellae-mahoneyi]|uniref:Uncharacterized protein n=1 Tax=Podospora bellae-mahoneyi TaxID=2093777 RepID=A0ABR0FJB1_9PEZI|nr:hypothetical protein QC761_401333 [Podospora bellae-mahoneyi]
MHFPSLTAILAGLITTVTADGMSVYSKCLPAQGSTARNAWASGIPTLGCTGLMPGEGAYTTTLLECRGFMSFVLFGRGKFFAVFGLACRVCG